MQTVLRSENTLHACWRNILQLKKFRAVQMFGVKWMHTKMTRESLWQWNKTESYSFHFKWYYLVTTDLKRKGYICLKRKDNNINFEIECIQYVPCGCLCYILDSVQPSVLESRRDIETWKCCCCYWCCDGVDFCMNLEEEWLWQLATTELQTRRQLCFV